METLVYYMKPGFDTSSLNLTVDKAALAARGLSVAEKYLDNEYDIYLVDESPAVIDTLDSKFDYVVSVRKGKDGKVKIKRGIFANYLTELSDFWELTDEAISAVLFIILNDHNINDIILAQLQIERFTSLATLELNANKINDTKNCTQMHGVVNTKIK